MSKQFLNQAFVRMVVSVMLYFFALTIKTLAIVLPVGLCVYGILQTFWFDNLPSIYDYFSWLSRQPVELKATMPSVIEAFIFVVSILIGFYLWKRQVRTLKKIESVELVDHILQKVANDIMFLKSYVDTIVKIKNLDSTSPSSQGIRLFKYIIFYAPEFNIRVKNIEKLKWEYALATRVLERYTRYSSIPKKMDDLNNKIIRLQHAAIYFSSLGLDLNQTAASYVGEKYEPCARLFCECSDETSRDIWMWSSYVSSSISKAIIGITWKEFILQCKMFPQLVRIFEAMALGSKVSIQDAKDIYDTLHNKK